MVHHDAHEINRLVGEFTDLQEQWERNPSAFDWRALQSLAQRGAQAYNEGGGPSFQSLALDGMRHGEFHERFLADMLRAGFDPFKLAQAGNGGHPIPVIDHANLAEAAEDNPSSQRMRASLMDLARMRFERFANEVQLGKQASASPLYDIVDACAESIPEDLLQMIDSRLVERARSTPARRAINPVEGYLSTAEMQIENSRRPHG
jgi:hypothetical protein